MTATSSDSQRDVVPRWRTAIDTSHNGELDSLSQPVTPALVDTDFDNKKRLWEKERSESFAAELYGAALILDRLDEAEDARRFLTDENNNTSATARALATPFGLPKMAASSELADMSAVANERIRIARYFLARDARNSLKWVDMARAYTTLGIHERAEKAISVALSLAPTSRFVLRAAASYFAHAKDYERGLRVLQRSARTKEDPWLSAAELALAEAADLRPLSIRSARSIIETQKFSPKHLSELRSALGTLEMRAGKNRNAKRLITASLEDATDNAIAQAEWASESVGIEVAKETLSKPLAYEARARSYADDGDWEQAISSTGLWLDDVPFDASAAVFGSFIASTGLRDFSRAVELADRGLLSNSDSSTLLNNKAYALLELGQTEEARKVLDRMPLRSDEVEGTVAQHATHGLFKYRIGLPEAGRALYLEAIQLARHNQLLDMGAMAKIMLAREEMRLHSEIAESFLADAISASSSVQKPEIRAWLTDLLAEAAREGRNK